MQLSDTRINDMDERAKELDRFWEKAKAWALLAKNTVDPETFLCLEAEREYFASDESLQDREAISDVAADNGIEARCLWLLHYKLIILADKNEDDKRADSWFTSPEAERLLQDAFFEVRQIRRKLGVDPGIDDLTQRRPRQNQIEKAARQERILKIYQSGITGYSEIQDELGLGINIGMIRKDIFELKKAGRLEV